MNYLDFIKQLIRDAGAGPIPSAPIAAPPTHVVIPAPVEPVLLPTHVNLPPPIIVEPDWLKFCRPMTQHFESCYLVAYCDAASKMGRALQEAGLWYKYLGNRVVATKFEHLDGKPWTVGYGATGGAIIEGTIWTQEKADSDLIRRLLAVGIVVDQLVTAELLPYQKAAIVDFTYNEGQGRLATSNMLKCLNARNFSDAMVELLEFDLAGGRKMEGLVARRQANKTLFTLGSWHP